MCPVVLRLLLSWDHTKAISWVWKFVVKQANLGLFVKLLNRANIKVTIVCYLYINIGLGSNL